jgi:hypothetical protein
LSSHYSIAATRERRRDSTLRRATLSWWLVLLLGGIARLDAQAVRLDYPLGRFSMCGATQTCDAVLERWNQASWSDLVDDGFNSGPQALAAVRWYSTEGACTPGAGCKDQLRSCGGAEVPDPATSHFCGVTDELGNVLLSHAMGPDQGRYEELHRFTELLRLPFTGDPQNPGANGLQCWKYRVDGAGLYDQAGDLCIEDDSASDASLRILGAYGIACAKQRAGIWEVTDVDFCADYMEQGRAIWGLGTADHGEVRLLANGQYYLAASYRNQEFAPTADVSFRADYYELQFLMDFAEHLHDPVLVQGVKDMLGHYLVAADVSATGNHLHRGKTGHFDALATSFACDSPDTVADACGVATPVTSLCSFVDQFDTWRAVPALSGLRNVHPEAVEGTVDALLFQYWWEQFAGGHATLFGPTASKPFEIWVSTSDGGVRCLDDSYKTMGMWVPLGAALDATYTTQAIGHLVDNRYNGTLEQFGGAAYYGGYYSQFAQRAIGAATGMIDPALWARSPLPRDFFSVAPCRAFDTRSGSPLPSGVQQVVAVVGGPCPVPASAKALAINVTVVAPGGVGHLTVFAGDAVLPPTSTLNFVAGHTRANNAVVSLASNGNGTLALHPIAAGGGSVHVVIDVTGYFQ